MKRLSSRVAIAVVFVLTICSATLLVLKAWQTRPGARLAANQALLNGPLVVYKSEKLTREANNQLELRLDVQRLYGLSTELKGEVDHANPDATHHEPDRPKAHTRHRKACEAN